MRRLKTFVHVDGVAYGPDSHVPDEVAQRITNPDVWADPAGAPTAGPIDDPAPERPVIQTGGPAPARPADSDGKPAWVEYAVARGAAREDAERSTKPQLIEAYGTPAS